MYLYVLYVEKGKAVSRPHDMSLMNYLSVFGLQVYNVVYFSQYQYLFDVYH